MISSFTIPFWSNVCRSDTLAKLPHVSPSLPPLFTALSDVLVRRGRPDGEEGLASSLNALEFDDDADFAQFFSAFRSQVMWTVRNLTRLFPLDAIQAMVARAQSVLSAHPQATDELNEFKLATMLSTAQLHHEGLTAMLEAVMGGVPGELLPSQSGEGSGARPPPGKAADVAAARGQLEALTALLLR